MGPTYLGAAWLTEEPTSTMAWATLATGAAQTVGAGLWLAKTVMGPKQVLVKDELRTSAVIAPTTFGPESAGFSISGTF